MRIRDDLEGLGFIAKIVSALAVELTDAEETQLARKPTENLEAYDSYLRAEIGLHGSGPRAISRLGTWTGNWTKLPRHPVSPGFSHGLG